VLYNGTVLLQDSFTTFDKGWTLPNGLEAEKFPWMKKLEDHWFLYIRNVSLGPLGWGSSGAEVCFLLKRWSFFEFMAGYFDMTFHVL